MYSGKQPRRQLSSRGRNEHIYQNAPGAAWSFGQLPSSGEKQYSTYGSSTSRTKSGPFAPSQQYSNGVDRTPITISSGSSWHQYPASPPRPTPKRHSTPSILYGHTDKRFRRHKSPNTIQKPWVIPEDAKQHLLESQEQFDQADMTDLFGFNDNTIYQNRSQPRHEVSEPKGNLASDTSFRRLGSHRYSPAHPQRHYSRATHQPRHKAQEYTPFHEKRENSVEFVSSRRLPLDGYAFDRNYVPFSDSPLAPRPPFYQKPKLEDWDDAIQYLQSDEEGKVEVRVKGRYVHSCGNDRHLSDQIQRRKCEAPMTPRAQRTRINSTTQSVLPQRDRGLGLPLSTYRTLEAQYNSHFYEEEEGDENPLTMDPVLERRQHGSRGISQRILSSPFQTSNSELRTNTKLKDNHSRHVIQPSGDYLSSGISRARSAEVVDIDLDYSSSDASETIIDSSPRRRLITSYKKPGVERYAPLNNETSLKSLQIKQRKHDGQQEKVDSEGDGKYDQEKLHQERSASEIISKESNEELKKLDLDNLDNVTGETQNAKQRDEYRRRTMEQIEAVRLKKKEEEKAKERAPEDVKKKVDGIEVDIKEAAQIHAKKETTKEQALSLKPAKLSTIHETPDSKCQNDEPVIDDEDSLFVPEARKAVTSAAEVFAKQGPRAGVRAHREECRNKKLQGKFEARRKKGDAQKSDPHSPLKESGCVAPKPRPFGAMVDHSSTRQSEKPKAQTLSIWSDDEFEDITKVSNPALKYPAAERSALMEPYRTGTLPKISFLSEKSVSTLPPVSSPSRSKGTSKTKLMTELEREQLNKQQKKQEAKEREARREKQKAERRRRDDDKARQRKLEQLRHDAKETGSELTDELLYELVETYMAKREKEAQRRRETTARRERLRDFACDNLALEALSKTDKISATNSFETLPSDDEELTLEDQLRKANEIALKESMGALAKARGQSFAHAAAKRTVADFQTDSEESEEDPDDSLPPATTVLENEDGKANNNDGSESKTGNGEATRAQPNTSAPKVQSSPSALPLYDNSHLITTRKPHTVRVYTVWRKSTMNGVEKPSVEVERTLDREQANKLAAEHLRRNCKRNPISVSEDRDTNGLLVASLILDPLGQDRIDIGISVTLSSPDLLPDFDLHSYHNRIPEKIYYVVKYTSNKEVQGEKQETHIHHMKPCILSSFSELEMANSEAFTQFCKFIKPKTSRMDHVQQCSDWEKAARDVRENADRQGECFHVSADITETELQWLECFEIGFGVEMLEVKGPLN